MNLVVFDIDGTLTDTNAIDAEAFSRAVCVYFGRDPAPHEGLKSATLKLMS